MSHVLHTQFMGLQKQLSFVHLSRGFRNHKVSFREANILHISFANLSRRVSTKGMG